MKVAFEGSLYLKVCKALDQVIYEICSKGFDWESQRAPQKMSSETYQLLACICLFSVRGSLFWRLLLHLRFIVCDYCFAHSLLLVVATFCFGSLLTATMPCLLLITYCYRTACFRHLVRYLLQMLANEVG